MEYYSPIGPRAAIPKVRIGTVRLAGVDGVGTELSMPRPSAKGLADCATVLAFRPFPVPGGSLTILATPSRN